VSDLSGFTVLDLLDRIGLLADHQEIDALVAELEIRFTRQAYKTGQAVEALRQARQDLQVMRLQLAHDMEMQT
jgi:hypothetical protein